MPIKLFVHIMVRNSARAWETIDVEAWDNVPLDDSVVFADDIGGSVGQEVRIELRDEWGGVLDAVELEAI